MNEQHALFNILRDRLNRYQSKNPSFSIRAFSKKLGVTPGTISLFLLGKRKLSKKLVTKIAERLMLDPHEQSTLLGQFPKARKKQDADHLKYLQLSADQFHLVSDWHHFGILNLISLKSTIHHPEWIADRLGISVSKAEEAIERLIRLKMMTVTASGKYKRGASRFRTTDDVTNLSLRKSHDQNLELARTSLEQDPVELRDFTWITMPIDTQKLSIAKKLIRKFQDDLLDVLEEDAEPNEVYRMAIQLFPLTKKRANHL